MGLVGIHEQSEEAGGARFEVEALHFNFWILPRSILRWGNPFQRLTIYCIDIGIRVQHLAGTLKTIDVSIPLPGQSKFKFVDLYELVLDEQINDLLFGRPVNCSNGRLQYEREKTQIDDTVGKIKGVSRNAPGSSQFRLELVSPIVADDSRRTHYFRFRMIISDTSELMASKGWGFAKRGYLLDIRANDTREMIADIAARHKHNLKELKEFNCFVIAPHSYLPVHCSPQLHYSRLLEQRVWNTYLQSCGGISAKWKLVIHQWRSDSSKGSVSQLNPFRAYMHLHKEFGMGIWLIYILGILTAPAINTVVALFSR